MEIPAQATGSLAIGLNRIEGRVTDETGNGVNNAFVELYSNFGTMVSRQRSTGQGRFTFRGMGPGRYVIAVKPYGTNLLEQEKDIEINNQSSRSDTVMVDFRLMQDRRFQANDLGIVGTVFAQEVPQEARQLYKSGIDEVQSNPGKSLASLEAAVKLFPNYFDALAALGKAKIIGGKYADGYPYLLRAIDVNKKCSDCYYSLSLAFYKLDETAAAIKAIDAAAILQPKSPVVRLLQGMIYYRSNDLKNAETALLLAKSLTDKPNAEVHWQLSLVFNRLKKNHEAADELEQYLKTKSDLKSAEIDSVRSLITKLRKTT
ncbi:MAG: carboxypeptidase regulatory-like domain-containing protein [Pyrinomonadaceae bacterium]